MVPLRLRLRSGGLPMHVSVMSMLPMCAHGGQVKIRQWLGWSSGDPMHPKNGAGLPGVTIHRFDTLVAKFSPKWAGGWYSHADIARDQSLSKHRPKTCDGVSSSAMVVPSLPTDVYAQFQFVIHALAGDRRGAGSSALSPVIPVVLKSARNHHRRGAAMMASRNPVIARHQGLVGAEQFAHIGGVVDRGVKNRCSRQSARVRCTPHRFVRSLRPTRFGCTLRRVLRNHARAPDQRPTMRLAPLPNCSMWVRWRRGALAKQSR